jgi:phage shock protein A
MRRKSSYRELVMAESIFARVSRLLSATVEDAVDRMEQAGGDAVMREAIREADRAIDQVKADLQSTMARRLLAARQQKMFTERAEELTTKAKFALGQGREDLAEAAEQAFDRAMAGAGGIGFARADADTINRVAEIDFMQKSATVAQRLAALKAQQAA